MTVSERLDDLRISRNKVERIMEWFLRPQYVGKEYHEWEEAMTLLARMHADITDLLVKLQREEIFV